MSTATDTPTAAAPTAPPLPPIPDPERPIDVRGLPGDVIDHLRTLVEYMKGLESLPKPPPEFGPGIFESESRGDMTADDFKQLRRELWLGDPGERGGRG